MRITHVKQPTNDTCVSACLAMALGLDINHVISEFHGMYFAGSIDIIDFLESNDVGVTLPGASKYYEVDASGDYVEHTCDFTEPGVYFVTINSLNFENTLHEILVVVSPTTLDVTVYDPQYGNDGCVSYSPKDENFRTFIAIDCIITAEDYDLWQFKKWSETCSSDLRASDIWLAACEYARR